MVPGEAAPRTGREGDGEVKGVGAQGASDCVGPGGAVAGGAGGVVSVLHGLDVAAVLIAGQVLRAPVGPAPRGDNLVAVQIADDRDRADGVEVDFLRGERPGVSVLMSSNFRYYIVCTSCNQTMLLSPCLYHTETYPLTPICRCQRVLS